jgi:hypothetical protein
MKTSFFLCFSLKRAGLELETNMATLIGIMKTISREADTKEKGTYDRVYWVIWSVVYGGQLLFDVQHFGLVLACHFHNHVIHIKF